MTKLKFKVMNLHHFCIDMKIKYRCAQALNKTNTDATAIASGSRGAFRARRGSTSRERLPSCLKLPLTTASLLHLPYILLGVSNCTIKLALTANLQRNLINCKIFDKQTILACIHNQKERIIKK